MKWQNKVIMKKYWLICFSFMLLLYKMIILKNDSVLQIERNTTFKMVSSEIIDVMYQKYSLPNNVSERKLYVKFSPWTLFQVSLGNCKNCHLNKTCFDYNKNLWYPTACKSRIFSPWQVKKCFQQKIFCFIGDSRYECFPGSFSFSLLWISFFSESHSNLNKIQWKHNV